MLISNFLNYSSLGLGAIQRQGFNAPERQAVTLDARLDPKTPNEYAVQIAPPVIEPPQKVTEPKSASKKLNQNYDPASRAFLSVANFNPTIHRIDIYI